MEATPLFAGIPRDGIDSLMDRLEARIRRAEKGEVLLRAGLPAPGVGLLASGLLTISMTDAQGNRAVLGRVMPGEIFAEAYACLPGEPLLVDVIADASGEAVFLNPFAASARGGDTDRMRLNLLRMAAAKNLQLSRRMACLTPKTIRGRLLAYFSQQAIQAGSRAFDIPFDRQGLADYLNVDRSALSAELGRMQREGLLEARRSRIRLLSVQLEP